MNCLWQQNKTKHRQRCKQQQQQPTTDKGCKEKFSYYFIQQRSNLTKFDWNVAIYDLNWYILNMSLVITIHILEL